jgi:hypothetical protein
MKIKISSNISIVFSLALLMLISGCVANKSTQATLVNIYHSKNLFIDDYLAEPSPLVRNDAELIQYQKSALWDFSIAVNTKRENKVVELNSCASLFQYENEQLEPVQSFEYSALKSIEVACAALRLASTMQPSNHSYIRGFHFEKGAVEKLPNQLAMVISSAERKRLDADPNIKIWADVELVISVASEAADIFSVKVPGGSHTLRVLARGDTNGDGLEDLLLRDDQSVDEGSYSASKLYVLTKLDDKKLIQLLASY